MQTFGRRTVVTHVGHQRSVFALDKGGLNVTGTHQGVTEVPGLTTVIRQGHQRETEAVRIEGQNDAIVFSDEGLVLGLPTHATKIGVPELRFGVSTLGIIDPTSADHVFTSGPGKHLVTPLLPFLSYDPVECGQ